MKNIVILVASLVGNVLAYSQNGNFVEKKIVCKDSIERPFVIYTPENYQKDTQIPMVVFLHGAVGNPNLKSNPLYYAQQSNWLKLADEGNFMMVFPFGQKHTTWFDAVGTDMIQKIQTATIQEFSVNTNQVFLAGFSDGASGVMYQYLTNNSSYAGFFALCGSLNIAEKLGEISLYPTNANEKPIYIINTTEDPLYPVNQITKSIEHLQNYQSNVVYFTEEASHDMSYLENRSQEIIDFIKNNKKHTPFEINLSLDENVAISYSWLTINDFIKEKLPIDYSVKIINDKADFGVSYDFSYQGDGLKIKSFKKDSALEKMGAKVGDVILKMGEIAMENGYSPFGYLPYKKASDEAEVTLLRNEEKIVLKGTFNPAKEYSIFNKQPNAVIHAKIVNDELIINCKGVQSFSIHQNLLPKTISTFILNDKKMNAVFDTPIQCEN